MCGITGAADSLPTDVLRARVEAMTRRLIHRGPDDAGTWASARGDVVFGHRRLKILDLSDAGHQPMTSADGRWTITYNGEIYNHREIRRDLEATGIRFRGHSDTEVLVEALARWGVYATLDRLNAMYAFAAHDAREQVVHLARDPLGEKPLYFAAGTSALIFASELKAFEAVRDVNRTIDPHAIAQYLRLGYVPAPFTPYEGVRKLRAGTRIEWRKGEGCTEFTHWSLGDVVARRHERQTDLDALEALLRDSVRLRLDADVPVGVFLSGGIDSTAITALAIESSPEVHTFTAGFDDPAYDERVAAQGVADHLGTTHCVLPIAADDGLALADTLMSHYDEPYSDPSAIPMMLISRAAKEHVTVCLSGDGGDEVFGGYNRYLLGTELWPRIARIPHPVRRVAGHAVRRLPPDAVDRFASRLPGTNRVRNAGDKLDRLATLLTTRRTEDLGERLVAIWPDELPLSRDSFPASDVEVPAGLSPTERLMYLDGVTTLPDQMLVKVDRASMAASLEVRAPMLDRRVVEAAWSAPADLRISTGETKRALREITRRHVPDDLVHRPKIGFDPPLGDWLRGPLRHWAEELLMPAKLDSVGLDSARIRATWNAHQRGRRNEYRLWSVLMLQSWMGGGV